MKILGLFRLRLWQPHFCLMSDVCHCQPFVESQAIADVELWILYDYMSHCVAS